ncbi:dnaJ homolog subfamily C member 4-like [Rhineura floridana]|uniref:dnaJ homolog subfamily C member 4-like n=1 Tax=Rhineura floridana TaxID=261503 RepID=UPI002AC806B8|nr:dnaJ homolog subfamily C member 4-like [Rhineura floridana]
MALINRGLINSCIILHPDSDPVNPDLHSQFVKLNEAYQLLSKESSKRIYDSFQMAPGARLAPGSHHGSSSRRSPFGFAESGKRSAPEPDEDLWYWQQFHQASSEPFSGPEVKRKHRQNGRLFGYCILLMVGSLVVHYIGFRKLEDLHNNFMDEKNRVITQIYKENKERARFLTTECDPWAWEPGEEYALNLDWEGSPEKYVSRDGIDSTAISLIRHY